MKNRSDSLIAISVVLCSLVVLAALTFALSGWRPVKNKNSLQIDFPDVTGIRVHSQVRYAGAPAGTVTNMRLLTDEERVATANATVRVIVELYNSVPPLPDDIRATLGSDSLLSEKFVALSPGTPERAKLPNNAVLRGVGSASLDKLFDSVGPLIESVDSLALQLGRTLKSFDVVVEKTGDTVDTFHKGIADALPRISKLADSLKATSDEATTTVKRIDKLVDDADPLLKTDLKKLGEAIGDMQKTLDSAGKLMTNTDKNIGARMQELSVVLQNLKVMSTQAKAFTKAIGEKPNRVIFSGKEKKLPTEQEILRSTKPVPVP
jgi:phospholipid/cholesterol/gamma-HCH transport system substrate-binding protein